MATMCITRVGGRMAKYLAVATVEYIYEFDEDDIPAGFTPEQYAEDCWIYGGFNIDGHEMEVNKL